MHIHMYIDPATHVTLARVPAMQAADARLAVEAAEAAWEGWRSKTSKVSKWLDVCCAALGWGSGVGMMTVWGRVWRCG